MSPEADIGNRVTGRWSCQEKKGLHHTKGKKGKARDQGGRGGGGASIRPLDRRGIQVRVTSTS